MDVEHIMVPNNYGANLYSHAVRVGSILYCTGMSAREPDGKVHAPGDPAEQARYCFERLRQVLEAAGCTFKDIVRLTAYMTNFEHRSAINEVRYSYFSDPLPACTGICVPGLSDPELLYEVEAIAVIPE